LVSRGQTAFVRGLAATLAVSCVAANLDLGAAPATATPRHTTHGRQARVTPTARAAAAAWWATDGQKVLNGFHNGQCTDWASRKRPDVLQRVFTYAYALSVRLRHRVIVNNWDAGRWTAHARWAHIPTGHAPERGALMVFQRGEYGGVVVPKSHIAYVENINGNGSIRVSQMHAPRLGQVTYHTFPAYVGRMSGISFIYR
jgi:surface antigen